MTKNDGDIALLVIKKKFGLDTTVFMFNCCSKLDKLRKVKSENKITKKYKFRRIQLAVMRKNLRKANERSEGVSYQTNLGINTANSNNNVIVSPVNDQTINSPRIVYFDIETTGLEETCEILQIAAVSDKYRFSV